MNPLSVVVRTVCDLFAWFMIVFGVNVLLHGYVTPGGGFGPGGSRYVRVSMVAPPAVLRDACRRISAPWVAAVAP